MAVRTAPAGRRRAAMALAWPLLALGFACGGGFPAMAAGSVYTTLDSCETLRASEEGGSVSQRCAGLGDFAVFIDEGDLRLSVSFGAPSADFRSFGPFNSIGRTVEWRVGADGTPHATIVRYRVDRGDGGATGDVLMVSRLGGAGEPSCPVALVDVTTGEETNGVARGVAAMAPRLSCDAPPIIIGGADSLAASYRDAVPEGRSSASD